MHHPPPKVRVESLKSDIDAKKGRKPGWIYKTPAVASKSDRCRWFGFR